MSETNVLKPITQGAFRLSGYVGLGLLAYSAGYTRALIHSKTSIIEQGLATTRVLFSVSGVPAWTGTMGFLGIALSFIYIGWVLHQLRPEATDSGEIP